MTQLTTIAKRFTCPREIEDAEAFAELAAGTIWVESTGDENTYYADDFGNRFYAKNYPDTWPRSR